LGRSRDHKAPRYVFFSTAVTAGRLGEECNHQSAVRSTETGLQVPGRQHARLTSHSSLCNITSVIRDKLTPVSALNIKTMIQGIARSLVTTSRETSSERDKITVFWEVTSRSLMHENQSFAGINCFRLQIIKPYDKGRSSVHLPDNHNLDTAVKTLKPDPFMSLYPQITPKHAQQSK